VREALACGTLARLFAREHSRGDHLSRGGDEHGFSSSSERRLSTRNTAEPESRAHCVRDGMPRARAREDSEPRGRSGAARPASIIVVVVVVVVGGGGGGDACVCVDALFG